MNTGEKCNRSITLIQSPLLSINPNLKSSQKDKELINAKILQHQNPEALMRMMQLRKTSTKLVKIKRYNIKQERNPQLTKATEIIIQKLQREAQELKSKLPEANQVSHDK